MYDEEKKVVLKGAKARKLKKIKLEGRFERSLFVRISNKVNGKSLVKLLKEAHADIDQVFLPIRKNTTRSVYILCKTADVRETVDKHLQSLNNEKLGRLHVSIPKPRRETSKSKLSRKKKVKCEVDRCCLLLEFLPKEVTDEALEREFPEAEKVTRFNKRRCYIYFKKPKDAMKARIRISKEKIAGHNLKVKFNKIQLEGDDEENSSSEDS